MNRFHEEFFTQKPYFSDQISLIRKHWGFMQTAMFYPGTGRDIVVTLQYLTGIVDRIFFCDCDELLINIQEDNAIKSELEKVSISIANVQEESFEGQRLTRFDVVSNGFALQVVYFHFSWQLALDYFITHRIKIGMLYLYGWGGEGGCELQYCYRVISPYSDDSEYIRKIQAKFHAVLLENYVEIDSGVLCYRSLAQFRGNWEHYFDNGVRLRFLMRDILLQTREYDGIVISYDMFRYFFHHHPLDERGQLLRKYHQQKRLAWSGRWLYQESYVLTTKILKAASERKWSSVATIAFGKQRHEGLFKAIYERVERTTLTLDIYYKDPTDFESLRNRCLKNPYDKE